ncbi:uncharacterized protein LOC124551846 isoform X1 [Schistocerca americana]|uniref:uncharacterized protein LOC124551846 isoform X1 n=2 Tax=Schistocerca americana TaxID=7009 RepID=UPI001F4FAB24|nr:uncharacterized protein LOC124551846 isoform X1 [Schistocerca americana]
MDEMRERLGSADSGSKKLSLAYLHQCKSKRQMDRARNGARYFRNPPQPHMCVQDFIHGSDRPCYINVMSWVKIVMPHNTEDSIPLYGGMRILPGSSSQRAQKKQPLIFAVMANPEILKISGKSAKNLSDRDGLIEVMLDFVEAMNPDIRFKRQFSVLKDRDLTGELKDIWLAVHMMRERERMEGVKGRDVVGPEGEWLQVAYETEVTLTEDNPGATTEPAVHSRENPTRDTLAAEQVSNEEWLYVSRETECAGGRHLEAASSTYGSKSRHRDADKNISNSPPPKVKQIENCHTGMNEKLTDCFSGVDATRQVPNSSRTTVCNSSESQGSHHTSNVVPHNTHQGLSNKKSEFEASAANAHSYKPNESPANVIHLDHDYNLVKPFKVEDRNEKRSCKNGQKRDHLVHEKKKSSTEKVPQSERGDSDKHKICAKTADGSASHHTQSDTTEKLCSGNPTDCSSVIKSKISKHESPTNTERNEHSKENLCTGTVTVSVP